jgi:hypothetical protein
MISVSCNCTYSSQVPDAFNGKTVPCPKCGQPLTIGTGGAATPTASTSASASESKGVSTTDILPPKKRPTTMMAFPLFGDQEKNSEEEPRSDAPSTRRLVPCKGCGAGMSERERYCSKCGWDTKENQRKCKMCQLPYILQDGMGSTGAQVGISAVAGGITGYLEGYVAGVAAALLMGGVGTLVNSLTAGFKCTGCNKGIEPKLMNSEEKKAAAGKRLGFMIASIVLILGAAGAGFYWFTNR